MINAVLVIVRSGVIESVHVGTEEELKTRFSDVTWTDYGYKQCARVTDYVSYELFTRIN